MCMLLWAQNILFFFSVNVMCRATALLECDPPDSEFYAGLEVSRLSAADSRTEQEEQNLGALFEYMSVTTSQHSRS